MADHFKNAEGNAVCGARPTGFLSRRRIELTDDLHRCDCRRCLAILSKRTPREASGVSIGSLRADAQLHIGQRLPYVEKVPL